MLSVPVHKDVTEYQPKVIGGLTARTIICIGAAVGSALAFGMLCTFVFHVDINDVIYLVWLAATPAALVGFYTPHGLNFEKFAPLWLAHNFNEQCLVYDSASNRGEFKAEADALKKAYADERKCANGKELSKLYKTNGIEMWEPGGALEPMNITDPNKRQIEDFWSD